MWHHSSSAQPGPCYTSTLHITSTLRTYNVAFAAGMNFNG